MSLTIKEKVEWGSHERDQKGAVWHEEAVQGGVHEHVESKYSSHSARRGQVGHGGSHGTRLYYSGGVNNSSALR